MDKAITPTPESATPLETLQSAPPEPSQELTLQETWPPAERRLSEPFLGDPHIALVERALSNFVKSRRLALRVTDERDWTDVGGKPYLNSSGALKVAAVFGVSLTGMQVEAAREEHQGKEVVRYVARTTAKFLGREVDVEGIASSDDPFFAKKDGKLLPTSEINLNSVRKKAVTNAQSRAVRAILGLGGLTWDEVQQAGVAQENVASATYARRAEKAPAEKAPEAKTATAPSVAKAAAATRPQRFGHGTPRTRFKNMLSDIASFEDVPQGRVLRRYTEFTGTDGQPRWAESVEAMSDAWIDRSMAAVERDWRSVPWSRTAGASPSKSVAS